MTEFEDLEKAARIISSKELENIDKQTWEWAVKTFDHGIYEWAETKDEAVLEKLLGLFDDECDFPEVMYNLVHAIERYPRDVYVRILLRNMKKALFHYPNWYIGLIFAIWNDLECRSYFEGYMLDVPRPILLTLFNRMEVDALPVHQELIVKWRSQILKTVPLDLEESSS